MTGLRFVLALALLSICQARAAAAPFPGHVPASFHVTQNGEAAYSVPIQVPPANLHPDLALSYNSNGGDERLGKGWLLTGVSAITRCRANLADDGYRGAINYDAGDRFCLDGQRLLNVTGTYGAAGSGYRTALETWRDVQASSDLCGSAPCSFTVRTRDGSVWTYGLDDGRILADGRQDVRVWAVKSVVNRNGNAITYNYSADPVGSGAGKGQYYVTKIAYGGNATTGLAAPFSMDFDYVARPDPVGGYVGGSRVATAALLSTITTSVQGRTALQYRLSYQRGGLSQGSRLSTIAICDNVDSSANCLEPTSIAWSDGTPAASVATLAPIDSDKPVQSLAADLNGDGRGDLALVTSSDNMWSIRGYLSNGADFAPCATAAQLPATSTPLQVGDIDGSGRAALLQLYPAGDGSTSARWLIAGSDGCSFTTASQTLPDADWTTTSWAIDVNGDGRTDFLTGATGDGGLQLTALISNGTGLAASNAGSISVQSGQQFYPMDVNGDGMVDLVQVYTDDGQLTLSTYLSTGATYAAGPTSTPNVPGSPIGMWPMEVSNDGLVSLVRGSTDNGSLSLTILASDGTGRFVAGTPTATGRGAAPTDTFWPQDFFGLGRSSLVQLVTDDGAVAASIYRPVGGGFDNGTAMTTTLDTGAAFSWALDLAGRGMSGIVQATRNSGSLSMAVLGYAGAKADLATGFSDGLGGIIQPSYGPMSDTTIYSPGSTAAYPSGPAGRYRYAAAPAQAPFQRVGGGTAYLVSAYRKTSKATGSAGYDYRYGYTYSGGLNDMAGRGWLGFARVSETAPDGLVTSRLLNQSYPLTGTVASTVKSCDSATAADRLCPAAATTILSRSLTSYQTDPTATAGPGALTAPAQVVKSIVRFETYVYGALDFARARSYRHDDYGDVILRTELGYVDAANAPTDPASVSYTCYAYADDPAQWRLGRPRAIKISASPDCTNIATFRPGTDLRLETMTYSEAGNLATHAIWDDANSVFQTRQYLHDQYGNLVSATEPGGRSTQFTVDPTFHAYTVKRASPANATDRSLIEQFAFDPRFGTLVAKLDPRGSLSVNCIDSFGRIIATQRSLPQSSVLSDPACLASGAIGYAVPATPLTTTSTTHRVSDPGSIRLEINERQSWGDSGTAAQWQWHRAYLDGLGRPYAVLAEKGPATGNVLVCTGHDFGGRVAWVTAPRFSAASSPDCAAPSAAAPGSSMAYDVYRRPVRLVHAAGSDGSGTSVTTYAYSAGETTRVTYAASDSYSYAKLLQHRSFGEEKRLVSFSVPSDGGAATSYGYDLLGRLVRATGPPTVADPNGIATRITYDSLGRRTSIDNPDQNSSSDPTVKAMRYAYDPTTGFLATTKDAAGDTIGFTRDLLGRVVAQTQSDGTAIAFSYDDPSAGGQGRLTQVSATAQGNPIYSYAYRYDALGRRIGQTLTVGADSYATTDAFDPQGRRTSRTYPNGLTLQESYSFGDLATQILGSATVTYSDPTPFGRPGSVRLSNGVSASYVYSPLDELHSWAVTSAQSEVLLSLTLDWDHLGQMGGLADTSPGSGGKRTETFGHGSARLTSATAPGLYGSVAYAFDPAGNMCPAEATCTWSAHRLISRSGGALPAANIAYNDDGTVKTASLGGQNRSFSYDALGRLISASVGGSEVLSGVVYDNRGRRLSRNAAGTTVRTPTGDYRTGAGAGQPSTILVSGPVGTVLQLDVDGSAEQASFYHQNHLSSTVLVTDAAGAATDQPAYDPYGRLTAGTDPERAYQGARPEEEAALYYFGSRYYDPAIGRFLSPDSRLGSSLTSADTLNRYAFALNDPASYVDVGGHGIWDEIGGALVGALEVAAGVAIDVLSDGALEPVGGALIGGGIGGFQYAVTAGHNFSWKQYGIQTAIGAATGLLTGGGGGEADAGAAEAEEAAEMAGSDAAESSPGELASDEHPPEARLESSPRAEDPPAQAKNEVGEDAGDRPAEESEAEEADKDGEEKCEESAGLAPSTLVDGPGGRRALGGLRVGDLLFGIDPRTGATLARAVSRIESAHSSYYRIRIGGRELLASPGQLFAVTDRGWVEARDLKAGDRIRTLDGGTALVAEIAAAPEATELVALEVDDIHNFTAGGDLLVHNNGGCRQAAVGRTPGKWSRTGREVQARMEGQGDFRAKAGGGYEVNVQETRGGPKVWKDFDEKIHMGHRTDAVSWWNSTGRYYGAKWPEVRAWMLDSSNYEFEWGPLNSSNGSIVGQSQTYLPPANWPAGAAWPP